MIGNECVVYKPAFSEEWMGLSEAWKRFIELLGTVHDLGRVSALASWDQQTYMPPEGAKARAEQKATLQKLMHRIFTQDEMGKLLSQLEKEMEGAPYDSDEAGLLRVVRREYDIDTKLPVDLVERLSLASSRGFEAWIQARAENDFELFRPHLERLVELQIEMAEVLGYTGTRYDAALDLFEPGMLTSQVASLLDELKGRLIPLVEAIQERRKFLGERDTSADILHQQFPDAEQWDFTMDVVEKLGFSLTSGRQDRSEHPFTTGFAPGDVRITTHIHRRALESGLFASIHEAGHGIYEQGLPKGPFERTPLSSVPSLGLHESQSRLWENLVGRSRPFWTYFYPKLQNRFRTQLAGVSLEQFYRAIHRVSPSLIRIEADEVTYNLHIMLRFELEQALLGEKLAVRDLPDAWNSKMESYLGVTPSSDVQGVLQDVHWSHGNFGYFPSYSLGNILSVQIYERALTDNSQIPAEIAKGNFAPLKEWLNTNLHALGNKFTPNETIRRVTGKDLETGPYLDYIERTYREVYGI